MSSERGPDATTGVGFSPVSGEAGDALNALGADGAALSPGWLFHTTAPRRAMINWPLCIGNHVPDENLADVNNNIVR
jgi:hypothetical protein